MIDPEKLKAWADFVIKLGAMTIIAFYLLYFQTQTVSTSLFSLKENLSLHSTDTSFMIKQNEKLQNSIEILQRTLRQICVNTATDFVQRRDCQ